MWNGTKKRWRQALDSRLSASTRIFSVLEIVCFYASLAALIGLGAQALGVDFSPTRRACLNVALAAAVGFLTNWLAIEMLFKPYERQKRLFVWSQGLVPRNQAKIAQTVGEKVATELLDPSKVAERLCSVAVERFKSDVFKEKIATSFGDFLREHNRQIAEALAPQLVASISRIVKRQATAENVRELWNSALASKLNSTETREFVAKKILSCIERRAPVITNAFKNWLADYLRQFFERNVGLLIGGVGSELTAETIVAFIDWSSIELSLRDKLSERATLETIKKVFEEYVDEFHRWINSDDSRERVESWINEFKRNIVDALEKFVGSEISQIVNTLLTSPKLWGWIHNRLIPETLPWLEKTIREQTPGVLSEIRVDKLVAESIKRQDAREFHRMIDDVAAEHLGAIQVLGFVLGGCVGLAQQLLEIVV